MAVNATGGDAKDGAKDKAGGIIGEEWHDTHWFIDNVAKDFNKGAEQVRIQLEAARKELKDKADNPSALAEFQAKLSEYTLFRNAQSSTVKAFKDIGAGIIQNFR